MPETEIEPSSVFACLNLTKVPSEDCLFKVKRPSPDVAVELVIARYGAVVDELFNSKPFVVKPEAVFPTSKSPAK